ncbi:hypothetical protein [Microbacterium sp. UBA3394]|uniref:hypothetical protein n=1 Tax=Microbacterium sp. UBA3394 TaxID=1946945 RepID=UPI000C4BA908|nr:hypothetical protein [Microbacterium sp. UBA3394]MAM53312.1 hypothetical protein [Microbacterium sp.]
MLDQDARPEDKVPEQLPAYAGEEADLESARFVGKHDDSSLWLMGSNEGSGVCLLAYEDEAAWVMGCASEGSPIEVGGLAGHFTVLPDGAPAPDGATQISENVYTHD